MSENDNPADAIVRERQRRARTIAYLEDHGAAEGRDWRWGTVADWDRPGVVDAGRTVEVKDRLIPKDKTALPIMITSSGVRLIGGPMLAAAMNSGRFPAEMPFAIGPVPQLDSLDACHGCLGDPAAPLSDCHPCMDCGATVHLQDSAYAVDCGSVCVPCGEKRYGDRIAEYFVPGALPPAQDRPSYPLWAADNEQAPAS